MAGKRRGGVAFALASVLGLAFAFALATATACTRDHSDHSSPPKAEERDPLAPLRAFEEAKRAQARFLDAPPSDRTMGPDPYAIAALPGEGAGTLEGEGEGDGAVGILRGRDAIVRLDASLVERARLATPRGPSSVALYTGPSRGPFRRGDVLVASEIEPVLGHYHVPAKGRSLERAPDVPLVGVRAARAVATGPEGVVYVVEEHDDRLITLRVREDGAIERREQTLPRGPIRLVRTRTTLFVACLLDHEIVALPVDRDGFAGPAVASARIDGPFWGFDAIDVEGGTLVVAGGVEDHPLDRRDGFFGWIDSFVYVFFLGGERERERDRDRELVRLHAINASEHGVIVPKAVAIARSATTTTTIATIAAYGSAKALRLEWSGDVRASPKVSSFDALPGASAVARIATGLAFADPLLDAWVALDGAGAIRVAPVTDAADGGVETSPRDPLAKLGEALFFTDLMAPSNRSDGALSRFTCETCHFEGYVDGRTHHTGRDDVHATTKPLLGLFDNRPHFSRALDPDLSSVAENEFRVAGAHSGTEPHFSVDAAQTPWTRELGLDRASYDATDLRRALMAFLMTFTPRVNPSSALVRSFTAEQRAGAAAFRDRCERCHEARATTDDPASRVPFERWESLVVGGNGPIVWASDAYAKTGVVPYVHERGARVPSLRRLYKKRPYFTNGHARDVVEVLARARWRSPRDASDPSLAFAHEGATDGEALDPVTARAIAAFLDLL